MSETKLAGAIDVYCYPVSANSSYIPLLFGGIERRYRPVYRETGSLRDAVAALDAGDDIVVHIHWEEFVLRDARSDVDADEAANAFLHELDAIRTRHGAIVWTIHNELPHVIAFQQQFFAMRRRLAQRADVIFVHNDASASLLASQVDLDRSKLRLLPHPSYLGHHEDAATLQAAAGQPFDRRIQAFGWIRAQKGFSEMIAMLPAPYLRSRRAVIRISGADVEAAAVIAAHADRTDIEWDVRHVPNAEVPALLRSAACVVLPYQRVLTSGVALLAMSVGAIVVAVDIPQLRELLPKQSRRFLYPRGDAAAFRNVIDDVLNCSLCERRESIAANLHVARDVHPTIIARRLAEAYDAVRARSYFVEPGSKPKSIV